jgi:hypothetical protein
LLPFLTIEASALSPISESGRPKPTLEGCRIETLPCGVWVVIPGLIRGTRVAALFYSLIESAKLAGVERRDHGE